LQLAAMQAELAAKEAALMAREARIAEVEGKLLARGKERSIDTRIAMPARRRADEAPTAGGEDAVAGCARRRSCACVQRKASRPSMHLQAAPLPLPMSAVPQLPLRDSSRSVERRRSSRLPQPSACAINDGPAHGIAGCHHSARPEAGRCERF